MSGSSLPLYLSACLSILVPAAASGQASGLPEGAGRDLVESVCTTCHGANQILRSSGYSESGWQELTGTMIDLSHVPTDRQAIIAYLAEHFPPNARRAPTLLPGAAKIEFVSWQVPTPGQRARDPIEDADGAIWWAGQWGNLVGRIDPATGDMNEFPLPDGAMPHTVTLDAAGDVWYTGNKNGTIGRLDRETGDIRVYKMPDPAARDPHSAIFDADGILWFTLQHSNMIGRLDPENGDIRLVSLSRPDGRPYGIKIDSGGVPWIACNGGNCLVRVDPRTMELTEIDLPDKATTVRRLDFDRDGRIWFVNSSLGRIGRYDPKSGEIREWPSPSGPDSHPYAIAVVDGVVWYNESGKRPDTLVRFDPETESFQSWPIPSGGIHAGIVRHMRATRDGNLLIHQSSTNNILLVRIGRHNATQ